MKNINGLKGLYHESNIGGSRWICDDSTENREILNNNNVHFSILSAMMNTGEVVYRIVVTNEEMIF